MLALLLLLFAAPRVEMVDEVYRIPPDDWRYIELGLKQRAAAVTARFQSAGGAPAVRLSLLRRDDLERFREGRPHGSIETTAEASAGMLNTDLPAPGDYVLVIANGSRETASVHLTVWLDFTRQSPPISQLSPQRQMIVVLLSFAVFFAIVTFSARRLLRGLRRG